MKKTLIPLLLVAVLLLASACTVARGVGDSGRMTASPPAQATDPTSTAHAVEPESDVPDIAECVDRIYRAVESTSFYDGNSRPDGLRLDADTAFELILSASRAGANGDLSYEFILGEETTAGSLTGVHSVSGDIYELNGYTYTVYQHTSLLTGNPGGVGFVKRPDDARWIEDVIASLEVLEATEEGLDIDAGYFIEKEPVDAADTSERIRYFVNYAGEVFSIESSEDSEGGFIAYKTNARVELSDIVRMYMANMTTDATYHSFEGNDVNLSSPDRDFTLCVIMQDGTHKHFDWMEGDELLRTLHGKQSGYSSIRCVARINTELVGFDGGAMCITSTYLDDDGDEVTYTLYLNEEGTLYRYLPNGFVQMRNAGINGTYFWRYDCFCTYISDSQLNYDAFVAAILE
ncbi:MAG: hypothetical protein Q4B99_02010 [Clostridia bacterium]|nr:hypothetical protein [Clostridia bacterium]